MLKVSKIGLLPIGQKFRFERGRFVYLITGKEGHWVYFRPQQNKFKVYRIAFNKMVVLFPQ